MFSKEYENQLTKIRYVQIAKIDCEKDKSLTYKICV